MSDLTQMQDTAPESPAEVLAELIAELAAEIAVLALEAGAERDGYARFDMDRDRTRVTCNRTTRGPAGVLYAYSSRAAGARPITRGEAVTLIAEAKARIGDAIINPPLCAACGHTEGIHRDGGIAPCFAYESPGTLCDCDEYKPDNGER